MSKTTIAEISTNIGSGITPYRKNESYWSSADVPWLKTEQVGEFEIYNTNEYISNLAVTENGMKLWKPKTITLAMYGEGKTRGRVSLLMREMTTNQACCNIEVDEKKATYLYVYYWLVNSYVRLRAISSGIRNNLNADLIREFPINIPSISKQTNISNFLYRLDKKIALNNTINAELEKVAKTLYNYWFVQFDFPNAKGKPYRTSGGKMEYNEVLKMEIPKGWKAERFIELATITTGKEDANFSTRDGIYNFFTCGRDILRCDKPAFSGQAVLLAGNGDFNVKHYTGEFNAYQRTYVLIPKHSAHYAAIYIAASDKVAELKRGAYGSIVKFITISDVANIALPVNHECNYLFEKLTVIINEIELLERENDELIKLRDFLLPLLMNGQVRVKEKSTKN